jgi:CheY-like chemotaxis protein
MDGICKKILIVEDDVYIHGVLRELLEAEGHSVVSAFNGQQALDVLANLESNPSLILLDLMMPVKDGFEFRKEQIADPKIAKVPVVVMSAYGTAHVNKEKLSVSAYLKKPVDLAEILQVIDKWSL